jgi:hypothetical protein
MPTNKQNQGQQKPFSFLSLRKANKDTEKKNQRKKEDAIVNTTEIVKTGS